MSEFTRIWKDARRSSMDEATEIDVELQMRKAIGPPGRELVTTGQSQSWKRFSPSCIFDHNLMSQLVSSHRVPRPKSPIQVSPLSLSLSLSPDSCLRVAIRSTTVQLPREMLKRSLRERKESGAEISRSEGRLKELTLIARKFPSIIISFWRRAD